MVMARKQSLANKRRSQKRSNKKRARTIRSMRQVNGGARGISGILDRISRVKRDKYPSELKEHFLNPDLLNPDEKKSVLEDGLQPLIAKPESSDIEEEEEEEELFSQSTLDNNLRDLLFLHVASRYKIPDEQLDREEQLDRDEQLDREKQLDRIKQFIFDDTNREIVLNPFIEHINVLFIENTKKLLQINKQQYNEEIDTITLNITELLDYASKLGSSIYDVFVSIGNQITLYNYYNNCLLFFDDKIESAKIIASLILCDIFKNPESGSTLVLRESEFLRQHVDNIKEELSVTAGGSKGKKKGKMRRPKSKTRKL
jgi:hypothetical protein